MAESSLLFALVRWLHSERVSQSCDPEAQSEWSQSYELSLPFSGMAFTRGRLYSLKIRNILILKDDVRHILISARQSPRPNGRYNGRQI